MDPDLNTGSTGSGQFDPKQYDFINNPQTPPKKSLIPNIGGGGGRSGLLIKAVLGLVVLTVVILLIALIFGGNKGVPKDQLTSIAKEQTGMITVSELAVQKSGGTDTKSLANSIVLTLSTDQNTLLAYLEKNGTKLKTKQLALGKDADVASKLEIAEQNGTFDVAYESAIKEMLSRYQSDLKVAFEATTGKTGKEILTTAYDNATLLIQDAENNK